LTQGKKTSAAKISLGGMNGARAFGSSEGTSDNSPAFQCLVKSVNISSPAGTTEICKTNQWHGGNHASSGQSSGQSSRWDSCWWHDGPALKRRAIFGLSRWDERKWAHSGGRGKTTAPGEENRRCQNQFGMDDGAARKNPKGISSFSPALTRSGYAG